MDNVLKAKESFARQLTCGLRALEKMARNYFQQSLTFSSPCHKLAQSPGMNPGWPYHNNIEWKATKARAPEGAWFSWLFILPPGKA
jgi:hypothetical protein